MAENYMEEVAEMLGVELGEGFTLVFENGCESYFSPYKITNVGLCDSRGKIEEFFLSRLLSGTYTIKKPILDKQEKKYLEGVLSPFKKRVRYIEKRCDSHNKSDYIKIKVGDDLIYLPQFPQGTMYKGMELDKEYTLEELELFK